MVLLHYFKRQWESANVHKYSKKYMPIKNVIINSMHYWVLFSVVVLYFLMAPGRAAPSYLSEFVQFCLVTAFCGCEIANF